MIVCLLSVCWEVLRAEFLPGRVFTDLAAAQAGLDAWVHDYNTARPHQGIGMACPVDRFGDGHRRTDPAGALREQALHADRDGRDWVTRKVAANGIISVARQAFSVGKHYGGTIVDIHVGDQLLHVWSGRELIKTKPRTTKGDIRKKRASLAR